MFYYPYAVNLFSYLDSVRDLHAQLAPLKSIPSNKKILLWSVEALDDRFLWQVLEWTKSQDLFDRTVWWLQPSHGYHADLVMTLGEKLHLIDIDLITLRLQAAECGTNLCWNPDTGRFLFMTGKPDKPNRVRLLWKFHLRGLLPRCDWSLFVDDHTHEEAAKLIPELTAAEFNQFAMTHNRSLDVVNVTHCTPDSNHNDGYPFDPRVYNRCSFRVISETMMLERRITSEKTWITMINRMPFIMTGYAGSLRYLQQRGYRTFESYLPIPQYDQIPDTEQRLDAVVTNTEFWLDHIEQQKDKVALDVEHNYELLCENIARTHDLAKKLTHALNEPDRSVYSLVPLTIGQQRWINFYYRIKDPSWPDCFFEQQFHTLPMWIQEECVQQFGYQPRNNH